MRRAGGVGRSASGSSVRQPRAAHVAVRWLDHSPSVPVRRSAIPRVGLAGVSRSRRVGSRAPAGSAARLKPNTQLLPGAFAPLDLMLLAQEVIRLDAEAEKNRPVPLSGDRVACA